MDSLSIVAAMPVLVVGIGGTAAILGGALALGIRHGIDWDHIAAITDITSTSTTVVQTPAAGWLTGEPGVQLTDEGHHQLATMAGGSASAPVASVTAHQFAVVGAGMDTVALPGLHETGMLHFLTEQRRAIYLGTLYALGHGTMVIGLGLLAILFTQILPGWVDPLMQRIVGTTLIFLGLYLCYSLYRFFRSGEEFRIRSRWMLVFAAIGNVYHRLLHRLQGQHADHDDHHVEAGQQYGARTAYAIGLIHGIGAETGTQVLIIGTAVGAASKGMGIATLFVFVFGIIVSNSIVTVLTTTGFLSAGRRQWIYVIVGAIAAVFSLVVGLVFLLASSNILPNLDQYFRWIGGPKR